MVNLTGIDWSQVALDKAKLYAPSGVFIKADIRNTGLPTEAFDTVVLLGVLDYFEDWDEILTEARRVLARGGIIVATLLRGFNNHNWTAYPHITSNWSFYQELKQ